MQNNHQKNNRKFDRSNSKPKSYSSKQINGHSKSLLERLATASTSNDKENYQSGKLLITKLNDIVQNKCVFGNRCAHLRARGECSFLHQKKDFQALEIPLPEKYLQNEQPLKKSKQQRKEDKIRQKAEREKRLQQKLNREDVRQVRQEKNQKLHDQIEKQQVPVKKVQEKIMDQKELVVQKIVKPLQSEILTLGHIFSQLNLITAAISQNEQNTFSESFSLKQMKLTLHEVRKRLLMKLKKNKQFEAIYKAFTQKQGAIVKKLIKNINTAYPDMVEEVKDAQKWKNVDLRQIQQTFTVGDVNRVLNLKKENQEIIEYYSRLFNEDYGFPVSFQSIEEEQVEIRQGGLLPLTKFYLLPVIAPNFTFERVFLSLNLSFNELKALAEFSSMLIPQQIAQKSPVQKTYCIDLNTISYTKFVQQIMNEHLNDYHQKIKGPAKEFEFGKIQENLKKYRTFLAKQKEKIIKINKDNSFVLIVYNIKSFIEKIESLGLGQNLDYDKIKKDRTMQEENTYERIFLLKEFINIIGENDQSKLKVIYVTPSKKFKPKNHKEIFSSIDKFLIDQQEQKQDEKE